MGSSSFQAAVSALFRPDEPALSLVYDDTYLNGGRIVDLRQIGDPETQLGQFWTLSVPKGTIGPGPLDYDAGKKAKLKRSHDWTARPFFTVEVDYLLVGKDDTPSDEVKRFQAEVVHCAAACKRMPYAAAVWSGSKSVHYHFRLADPPEFIATLKAGCANHHLWRHLDELLSMVLGEHDSGVFDQSAEGHKLIRTPGAKRENGKTQEILGVGAPVLFADLIRWCQEQINPNVMAEILARAPLKPKSSQRRWKLPAGWRRDLMAEHPPGTRGTGWFHVVKALACSGCSAPEFLRRPSAGEPYGAWNAPFLWWASALAFNARTEGWFFSQNASDWQDEKERARWWDWQGIQERLNEQTAFEFARDAHSGVDPDVVNLVRVWEDAIAVQAEADRAKAAKVRPHDTPGEEEEKLAVADGKVAQKVKDKPKGFNPTPFVQSFLLTFKQPLKRLNKKGGGHWMIFTGKCWEQIGDDLLMKFINDHLMPDGFREEQKSEVLKGIAHVVLHQDRWEQNPNAVPFDNGTLYTDPNLTHFGFIAGHNPADLAITYIPHSYDPAASAPLWDAWIQRMLPDAEQRAITQEWCGYCLVPGQPFQKFMLMVGAGANGKGTTMRMLEMMLGKEQYGSIQLAELSDKFSLGDLSGKKLVVDGDADSLSPSKLSGDSNKVVSIIKKWTGGDTLKVQVKNVQGWDTKIDAKLMLAANKKPRFVDTSKGVWRRLLIVNWSTDIGEREQIANYEQRFVPEMSGFINWALLGLQRLLHNTTFTRSAVMEHVIAEYREDCDSVLQFKSDYFSHDVQAGWHDLRPIYQAYAIEFCEQTGQNAVNFQEFRSRLGAYGIASYRPPLTDVVAGIPQDAGKPHVRHNWAIKHWRCTHGYLTRTATSTHYPASSALAANESRAPIAFPLPPQMTC